MGGVPVGQPQAWWAEDERHHKCGKASMPWRSVRRVSHMANVLAATPLDVNTPSPGSGDSPLQWRLLPRVEGGSGGSFGRGQGSGGAGWDEGLREDCAPLLPPVALAIFATFAIFELPTTSPQKPLSHRNGRGVGVRVL
jgi:hypothetical protein